MRAVIMLGQAMYLKVSRSSILRHLVNMRKTATSISMASVIKWRWLFGIGFAVLALILGNIIAASLGKDAKGLFNLFQLFLIFQFILGVGSRYLWRAVTLCLMPQATPPSPVTDEIVQNFTQTVTTTYKDHVHVIPPKPSWSVRVIQMIILTFLILTHFSFLAVFFLVRTEPTFFGMLLYACLGFFGEIVLGLYFFNFIRWSVGKVTNSIFKKNIEVLSRRVTLFLAIMYGLSVGIYGLCQAATPPVVKYIDVNLPKLSKSMDGYKIVQISDIHLGPTVGRSKLNNVVHIINQLDADAVVIVGDLVDSTVKVLHEAAEGLGDIKAKDGTFFVTGNHEYLAADVDSWFRYAKQRGITVLHNSQKKIYSSNDPKSYICMAGVDDIQANAVRYPGHGMDLDKALQGCDKGGPTILLVHQPKAAKIALDSKHDIQLILSGHTHGGQFFPFSILIYLVNPFYRGLYSIGDSQVFVGQGTQYWGVPMRVGSENEISVLILRAKR